jgi:hypothetical protein
MASDSHSPVLGNGLRFFAARAGTTMIQQDAFRWMTGREFALNHRLTLEQLIRRRIHVIFIGRANAGLLGKRATVSPARWHACRWCVAHP